LADDLSELSCFLQKHTGATGCYIGKLGYPEKAIEEEADENAHLDFESA